MTMLALEVALLSDRGGRNYNEDACGHWHSERQLCCVLADGAGGHGGGDIASKLTVQELIGRFSRQPSQDGQALAVLLRQTNDALIAQRVAGTPRQDMHSTAVCLVVDVFDRRAHWTHAGDSRLYWFRDRRLLLRTRDHSLVQSLVDAGIVSEQDMQTHPKRSELRSALGVPADQLEVSSADSAESVQVGDVFMLCTDGLWEYLSDATLERTLAAAVTPRGWLDALSAEVMAAASHKTSHDNFSALVVWASAA
jgi:serine/threonine protein phosphatase PrpC